jgi:predicted RecA/RadA family phage recombinase
MATVTEAKFYKTGDLVDYTPSGAVTGGQVLNVGGRAAVAHSDIAASAKGAIQVKGICAIQAGAVVGNAGDNVWWDEDGNPYGGTSGTGCATTNAAVGNFWLGTLTVALTATAGVAYVDLNRVNPQLPHWPNRTHVKKTADYTVDATNYGGVVHCDGGGESDDIIVITLPATVAGLEVTIQNDGADGTSQITVEVNGSDKILNPTALDDGDTLDNTLATAIRGDFVTFVGDGANGWIIKDFRGTWADGGAT